MDSDQEIELLRPIINSIIEANELIKRQAAERIELLSNLFMLLDKVIKSNASNEELVDIALLEIHNINDRVSNYGIQEASELDENYLRRLRLQSINKIMGELDTLEEEKILLRKKLDEIYEGKDGRDELIAILEEYVELENASNYKLVSEIAEMEQLKYQFEKSMEMYSVLSQYDPRIKTLEILEGHPQGISIYQLIQMLDISPYETRKIVNELINLSMVDKSEGSDIIKIPVNSVNISLINPI